MYDIKFIAVDFDMTLSMNEGNFPECANPSEGFEVLKEFQNLGGKVILWTCREEEPLQMAIDFCKKQGLEFDAINEQLPEQIQIGKMHGHKCTSRKLFADLYIDDKDPRSLTYGIDWELIRTMIIDLNIALRAA